MASIIQVFADMLRLRAGPQDLPASAAVLYGSLAAAAISAMLAIQRLYPFDVAGARVGLDLALQFALVTGALRVTGRPERFRQTYAALCGTGAFIVLLSWPLFDIMLDGAQTGLASIAGLLLLGLYGWSVVIVGHILRHALDLTLGKGVVIALIYVVVSTAIADLLLPAPELP